MYQSCTTLVQWMERPILATHRNAYQIPSIPLCINKSRSIIGITASSDSLNRSRVSTSQHTSIRTIFQSPEHDFDWHNPREWVLRSLRTWKCIQTDCESRSYGESLSAQPPCHCVLDVVRVLPNTKTKVFVDRRSVVGNSSTSQSTRENRQKFHHHKSIQQSVSEVLSRREGERRDEIVRFAAHDCLVRKGEKTCLEGIWGVCEVVDEDVVSVCKRELRWIDTT